MAVSRGINGFFGPLVKATYALPKTALIPLLILWLGIGSATNIVAVMSSTLLPFVVYTYHGIIGVPQMLIWSAQAMGVPKRGCCGRCYCRPPSTPSSPDSGSPLVFRS